MPHKFEPTKEVNIHSIKNFQQFLRNGLSLKNCTLQNIDFSKVDISWQNLKIKNTAFLGCQLKIDQEISLRRQGATIINAPTNLPYQPFRSQLYDWKELMKGYSFEKDESIDYKIYRHFSKQKYTPSINEALWQRIHDHAMDDALRVLLEFDKNGMTNKKCVGVMGGHSTRRDDPFYVKSALTAKLLTENDYLIASGGGPGIMEATNLGAYFAGKSEEDLLAAIKTLQKAPHYSDKKFHQQAFKVLDKYPKGAESLAIPTWFYGHEPSNLFASYIAKYFSNSIREDTLLAVSLYGIICAPGSAGTVQEIFMDATQNHYGTFNYISPMIFLGEEHYSVKTMIYPLLRQLAWGKEYYDLLHITDEPQEVLSFLQTHPPFKTKKN
ncbi:MAG: LOG family protein [Saprospiraceae bacterium]